MAKSKIPNSPKPGVVVIKLPPKKLEGWRSAVAKIVRAEIAESRTRVHRFDDPPIGTAAFGA